LVTDVVMPEMNGLRLAGAIRNERPDTQVMFMSGYTRDEVDRRGLTEPGEQAEWIIGRSGADDLVVAPVPLAQLALDNAAPLRVVIDDQQDWSVWHGRHL